MTADTSKYHLKILFLRLDEFRFYNLDICCEIVIHKIICGCSYHGHGSCSVLIYA